MSLGVIATVTVTLARAQPLGERRPHCIRLIKSCARQGCVDMVLPLHDGRGVEHGFPVASDEDAALKCHDALFLRNGPRATPCTDPEPASELGDEKGRWHD
jgi:hypothetical protein